MDKARIEDRILLLIKAYLTLKKNGTSKQITDFINWNNFGVEVTQRQVDKYLSVNQYKKCHKSRSSLKDCYDYTQKRGNARVYHIKEK